MRLDELRFPNYADEAGALLRRAGWSVDDTGLNSEVYYRDDRNYVLKLYNSRDYAYQAFLDLVVSNPNKHFPKIVGKPRKVTRAYYAVRMEKLDVAWNPVMLDTYLKVKRDQIADEDVEVYFSKVKYEHYLKAISYLNDNPEMIKALDLIVDFLLPNFKEDLHAGNIMQRSDGTLVIIDPVS